MDFEISEKEEHSPYVQILILIAYFLLGTIIFSIIAIIFLFAINPAMSFESLTSLSNGGVENIQALKSLQIFTSIGMFVLPPIILAYTEYKTPKKFFGLKQPRAMSLFLVVAIMIASMPLMEWAAVLNQKMVLPEFLKGLEFWMKEKEDAAAKLTTELLTVRKPWDFVINLLMIAVLPAIGEELTFRGGLQRALQRMFGNHHLAIWVAAIVFSAIHVQFYGFLPRMLLGAGFGYLYFYSGNLYYAMLGHFLNNGFAVCVAYYMQMHNMPLEKADEPLGFGWYAYLLSAIITIALFVYFKKNTNGRKLG